MGFLHGFLAAQTSDLEAYNRLVADTQDAVYTLAYAILGSRAPAERAVQSAFIQAYQGSGRRRFSSQHLLIYRALVDACLQGLNEGKDDFLKAEQLAAESGRAVWSSIWSLPPNLRLAAALVDVAGLDYEQASEVLSVKVNEIRRRLALARSILAKPSF